MTNHTPVRVRRAIPVAATASAILAQALALRLLLDADEAHVYLLGHSVQIECAFHAHFGLPCPGCGLTRSVVMALHGHLMRAWSVAPGGAAAILAIVLLTGGLAVLAILRARGSSLAEGFGLTLRRSVPVAAGLVFSVWTAGWATAFAIAFHHRY